MYSIAELGFEWDFNLCIIVLAQIEMTCMSNLTSANALEKKVSLPKTLTPNHRIIHPPILNDSHLLHLL